MLTRTGYRNVTLSARNTAKLIERVAAIAPTDPLGSMTAWVLPGVYPGEISPRGEKADPAEGA